MATRTASATSGRKIRVSALIGTLVSKYSAQCSETPGVSMSFLSHYQPQDRYTHLAEGLKRSKPRLRGS